MLFIVETQGASDVTQNEFVVDNFDRLEISEIILVSY